MRTLVVWPDSVDLVRFDSMQLSVAAQDDQGELIPDVPVTFSSNNTFVVGVSGGGLVRSVGPVGSATVTVSGGGDSKRIPVTVFALPARVIAAPRDTTVPLGQTYPLRVEVLDTDGAPLTSPAATYESSNLAVATVSASGSVTTVGSGTAAIIVRAGGASAGVSVRAYDPNAPAVVEVVPQDTTIAPLGSYQLGVRVISVGGQELSNPPLTFQSSNQAVATVSPAGVVASAGPGGVATITVRSDTARATATVAVVDSNAPGVIEVAPRDTAIRQLGSYQLRVRVLSVGGQELSNPPLTFESSNQAVATVSPTGLVSSAGPEGTATISLRSDTARAMAIVAVADSSIFGRLPLTGRPFPIAVSSADVVYVGQLDLNSLRRVDLPTLVFSGAVATGIAPSSVAFDGPGTTAFVANQYSRNVGVISVASNAQTETIPVTGDAFIVRVSPDGQLLWVTTNANQIFGIDLGTRAVVHQVSVAAVSNGIAFHPTADSILYASVLAGTVEEIDVTRDSILRTFTLGGLPQGIAVSPSGDELYVANEALGALQVVSVASGTVVATVSLAGGGFDVQLSPDGSSIWVSESGVGRVQVVDRVGRTVTRTIVTGGAPRRMAVSPTGPTVIVANEYGWVDFIR